MGEFILVWTFYCLGANDPDCRYMHKSFDTFGECVELLAEKDAEMNEWRVPHVIFCTDRDHFIELRQKDDKYSYNAPKRNITTE